MKFYNKRLVQILLVKKTKDYGFWHTAYKTVLHSETEKANQGERKINTYFWFLLVTKIIDEITFFSIFLKLKQAVPFFLFFSFFNKDNKYKNLVIKSLQRTITNQLEGSTFWRVNGLKVPPCCQFYNGRSTEEEYIQQVTAESILLPSKLNFTLFRIQELAEVSMTLSAKMSSSHMKRGSFYGILVKCLSCCTNIVQKCAFHKQKRCRQPVWKSGKVEMYQHKQFSFPDNNHYKILNLRTLSSKILVHVQHSYIGESLEWVL